MHETPLNLNFIGVEKMDKLANFLEHAVLIGLTALMFYPILGVAYFMIKAA